MDDTRNMALPLRHLKALLSVLETGGFASAGNEIRRSTSAVSRSVSILEEIFGLPLVTRGRGRVSATGAAAASSAPSLPPAASSSSVSTMRAFPRRRDCSRCRPTAATCRRW